MCKAEVTTEDAVKGDEGVEWAHRERGDAAAWSHTNHQVSIESTLPWLVEHAGCILSRCQKGRDEKTPFKRLHGKKPTRKFVPFGEKVLAKQITTDPMNRMNPRYQHGIWLGMRNNSAECFMGNADGVFRVREIRRLEPQSKMGH